MEYVFVSKRGIPHLASTLSLGQRREAMFHELGCLLDLVQQKFNVDIPHIAAVPKSSAPISTI